jgi:tetratricopeptide (TPR) repeat protein
VTTRNFAPVLVLILIVVLVLVSVWVVRLNRQSSPGEAIDPNYKLFMQMIDAGKRAQALDLGDSLFKTLFEERPENPALVLLAQRLHVAEQISTLIMSGIRSSQPKLLEGIPGMEDIGLSLPVHEDRVTQTLLTPPAQGLYWTHLSAFTGELVLDDMSVQQAIFLGQYYDLQMQNTIMKAGRQIAMADPNSSENSCYALVLPLMYLYGRDNAWEKIEPFFVFFSPNQLDVMWRFSLLQAERPQISARIAEYQAKMMDKDFSLELWALDAANICISNHRPDLARLSLHVALDSTKDRSKMAELRLKIAEGYAQCSDYAMAIQTCRRIADDLPNTPFYGRVMAMYFGYLAIEANAGQIIAETEPALQDSRCKSYLPQILYLRWWALCKVNRQDEAVRIAQWLLEQYPSDPCVAPILLERANDFLACQQHDQCFELLMRLTKDFAGTKSARQAEEILAHFKDSKTQQDNGRFSQVKTKNRL